MGWYIESSKPMPFSNNNERMLLMFPYIPHAKCYFDRLNPEEQVAYQMLVDGIQQRAPKISITLRPHDLDSIKRTIAAILCDRPELFYVNLWKCRIGKGNSAAIIRFDYLHTVSETQEIQKVLYYSWKALKKKLHAHLADKEKYRIIALDIGSKVTYQKSRKDIYYTVVAPVIHSKGACEGVSKLFLYYCQQEGIPAQIVFGTNDKRPHSWNQVWIRGQIRYIDITAIQLCPFFFRLFPGAILMSERMIRWLGYSLFS